MVGYWLHNQSHEGTMWLHRQQYDRIICVLLATQGCITSNMMMGNCDPTTDTMKHW
jgi:hypothetical protein